MSIIVDEDGRVDVTSFACIEERFFEHILERTRRLLTSSQTNVVTPIVGFGEAHIPIVIVTLLDTLTCPTGALISPLESGTRHGFTVVCPIDHINRGIDTPTLHVVEVVHTWHVHVFIAIHIEAVVAFEYHGGRVSRITMGHDRVLCVERNNGQQTTDYGYYFLFHNLLFSNTNLSN